MKLDLLFLESVHAIKCYAEQGSVILNTDVDQMAKSFNWWMRKFHRWGAILFAAPLLIVIVSGLLLQLKKEIVWIQPVTQQGSQNQPVIGWDQVLASSQNVTEAEVVSWSDIDRVDARVGKGVLKVRCKNGWEIQLDAATGDLLSSAYRRSDLIESIHDGSFFTDIAKLWVFLPNGIVLLALWFTGAYLWYLPFLAKKKKRNRKTSSAVKQGTVD